MAQRWDSLVLFTPRRYDALPGLAFPGNPDGYPTRDEVIAYLERYASEFNLPVQTDSRVRSLTVQDGWFLLDLGERQIRAKQAVVATGPFRAPRTPAWAGHSLRTCSRSTAATTGGPPTYRPEPRSSWAAEIPAIR